MTQAIKPLVLRALRAALGINPVAAFSVAAALLGAALDATAQTAQYVTLSGGGVLSVQTNQLVSVVGYDWANLPAILGHLASGVSLTLTPGVLHTNPPASSHIRQMAIGLKEVSVNGTGWATFRLTTPSSANVISNYVPADAIVIPASATGNVQIILESSPDLVSWTAANPGTYSALTVTNRFFRVRAVLQ